MVAVALVRLWQQGRPWTVDEGQGRRENKWGLDAGAFSL